MAGVAGGSTYRRRMRPRVTGPLVFVAIGLAMVGIGLAVALVGSVRCDGREMSVDDECRHRMRISTRPDLDGVRYDYTRTYEQERFARRWPGWVLAGCGGLVLSGGGVILYRRSVDARARRRHAEARAAVAAAEGWTYQATDWSVSHAWQDERLLAKPSVAQDVLKGYRSDRQFTLFDIEEPERRFTVCAVPLAIDPPTLQVIVAPWHLPHLQIVSPWPVDEVDLAKEELDWAVTARTSAPARARELLTPPVVAHVRAHELSFVLHHRWLSVTVPHVHDADALVPLVEATTRLAALLRNGHSENCGEGSLLNRIMNWIWPAARRPD